MTNSIVLAGSRLGINLVRSVSGFMVSFREKHRMLSYKMLASPCPGEPNGVTQEERDSLWYAWSVLHPDIIGRSSRKSGHALNVIVALSLFFMGIMLMMNAGRFGFFLPLTCMAGFLAVRRGKLNKLLAFDESNLCVARIQRASWSERLIISFAQARNQGVRFSPEMEAVENIVRGASDEDLSRIPADDIIGMLRMGRDISNMLYRNLGRITVEPAGEKSELIGRVASALPGPSLESVADSIRAGSAVTVRI